MNELKKLKFGQKIRALIKDKDLHISIVKLYENDVINEKKVNEVVETIYKSLPIPSRWFFGRNVIRDEVLELANEWFKLEKVISTK